MSASSSSPARSDDPVARVVLGLGLAESEDELRGVLIQNLEGDWPTVPEIAAAVVVTLMERCRFQRAVTAVVARKLFPYARSREPFGANVVVMDGTWMYCPDENGGAFYSIPSMQPIDPATVPQPIVTNVFSYDQAYRACKDLLG